jgi:heme exporter protein CcmD
MDAGNHMGFIVAAYVAAAVIVAALVAWVMLDYRAQQRTLADLDKRGVSRRSARSERALERAKEQA